MNINYTFKNSQIETQKTQIKKLRAFYKIHGEVK